MTASAFGDHWISELADGRNFDDDFVARMKEALRLAGKADARGRAGGNDVAGFESEDAGQELDEFGNLEDEFAGVGILQRFAADFELNIEVVGIGDLIGGNDPWAHRGECIEGLAHQPLRGSALVIAGADVVDDGVAEDVLRPVGGGDLAASFADNKSEFSFVIGRFRDFRQDDVCARSDDSRGKLVEDGGDAGNLRAGFGGVIAVIQADAEELVRARDGREQFYVGEGQLILSSGGGKLFGLGAALGPGFNQVQDGRKTGRLEIDYHVRA